MPAICTDSSGDYVYLALEDGDGYQFVARAARGDLSTWTAVYEPGAGSACNVTPAGDDKVLFYGNFGTNVTVLLHTISTGAEADISPASLGAKVVGCAAVNPSKPSEIIVTVGTDQDVLYTDDAGASWTTLESALGFDATALAVIWSAPGEEHRIFVAGDNGSNLDILYSPNQFASDDNFEGTLSAANVVSLEVIP